MAVRVHLLTGAEVATITTIVVEVAATWQQAVSVVVIAVADHFIVSLAVTKAGVAGHWVAGMEKKYLQEEGVVQDIITMQFLCWEVDMVVVLFSYMLVHL